MKRHKAGAKSVPLHPGIGWEEEFDLADAEKKQQRRTKSILLLEDEEPHIHLIRRAFERCNPDVRLVCSRSIAHAKSLVGKHNFDLLITDLMLPDGRGVDILRDAEITASLPIILMTSYGGEDVAVEALKAGAVDYVVKSATAFESLPQLAIKAICEWQAREVRKKTAEAVRKRESHLRMVLDATSGGVWDRDLIEDRVYYGSNWARMLGYKPEEVVPHTRFWHSLVHPDDRGRVLKAMDDHLSGLTEKYSAEFRMRTKGGEYKWVLSRGKVVERDSEGKPTRIVGTHTDISERKRAEEDIHKINAELENRVAERTKELLEANEQLCKEIAERKLLEKEVLSISERERRWTGQELHDSLGQQLTGIAIMSKVLSQKLADKNVSEAEDAEGISEMVKHAIEKTRAIARGLHPVDLGYAGLCKAMRNMAASTASLFNVECSFSGEEEIEVCDSSVAMNLYRIAQEAVTNAIRHGKTRNIEISLGYEVNKGCLRISNDGISIQEEAQESGGMGLRIMRYRAEMVDGKLDICQRLGGGTVVSCVFQLPNGWRTRDGTEDEFARDEVTEN